MTSAISGLQSGAVAILNAMIGKSVNGRTPFRHLASFLLQGKNAKVLLEGWADGIVEDGEVVILLNPDEDLLDNARVPLILEGQSLPRIVEGKCEEMFHIRLEAYVNGPEGTKILSSYVAKTLHHA